MGTKMAAKWTS